MTQKLQFPDILCGFDSQLSVSQNIGMVWGGVVGGADRCRSESVVFRQGFRGRSMIGTSGMFITHMQICRDAIFGVKLHTCLKSMHCTTSMQYTYLKLQNLARKT